MPGQSVSRFQQCSLCNSPRNSYSRSPRRAESPRLATHLLRLRGLRPKRFWGGRSMATIALVDDDSNILTSVSMALEAEGYRTVTYTDGVSALDGFSRSAPDLAILDIKMPRMDGTETLRR